MTKKRRSRYRGTHTLFARFWSNIRRRTNTRVRQEPVPSRRFSQRADVFSPDEGDGSGEPGVRRACAGQALRAAIGNSQSPIKLPPCVGFGGNSSGSRFDHGLVFDEWVDQEVALKEHCKLFGMQLQFIQLYEFIQPGGFGRGNPARSSRRSMCWRIYL